MEIDSSKQPLQKKDVTVRGFRYVLVGGASALIELGLFNVLFYLSSGQAPLANIVAVSLATLFNFLVNRKFTFNSVSNIWRSALLYALLFVFNLTFTTIITTWLISFGWLPLIAKLTTMTCVVLWNFALYNKVIFK